MNDRGFLLKSGSITSDETWGGDITLSGNVVIEKGVNVTVEPGSRIFFGETNPGEDGNPLEFFNRNYTRHQVDPMVFPAVSGRKVFLLVRGKFSARGTRKDKVVFESGEHNGVIALGSSGRREPAAKLELDHAIVNGVSALFAGPGTFLKLTGTRVEGCAYGAVITGRSHIENSVFVNNRNGIFIADHEDIIILRCLISNNREYGIVFNSTDTVSRRVDISDNTFEGNDVGVHLFRVNNAHIANNVFSGHRIACYASHASGVELTGNSFRKSSCCDVILCRDSHKVLIKNNRFIGSARELKFMHNSSVILSGNTFKPRPRPCIVLPRSLCMLMKKYVRNLLIKNKSPLADAFFRLYYYIAVLAAASFLRFFLGFNVYLRRGMLLRDWHPGVSDVDLFAVARKEYSPRQEKKIIRAVLAGYGVLKFFFPVIGELHISNSKELRNYLRYGGVRAWEAGYYWKPLLGAPRITGEYRFIRDKFKFDCATEVLNLWQICCGAYFFEKKSGETSVRFLKAVIDILRYTYYLQQENPIPVFSSRSEVVRTYKNNGVNELESLGSDVLEIIERYWSRRRFENRFYERVYAEVLIYIDRVFKKHLSLETRRNQGNEYEFVEKVYDLKYRQEKGWREFSEEIFRNASGVILKIILDTPGLFYVVVDDKITYSDAYCTAEFMKRAKMGFLSPHTNIIILTENTYGIMLNCLLMETPFKKFFPDYFKEGSRVFVSRFLKRSVANYRNMRPPAIRSDLIKLFALEAVAELAVSGRVEKKASLQGGLYKTFFLSNLAALKIFLTENKIITPPLFENTFSYLENKNPGKDRLGVKNRRFDNYTFTSSILRELSGIIEKETL